MAQAKKPKTEVVHDSSRYAIGLAPGELRVRLGPKCENRSAYIDKLLRKYGMQQFIGCGAR